MKLLEDCSFLRNLKKPTDGRDIDERVPHKLYIYTSLYDSISCLNVVTF